MIFSSRVTTMLAVWHCKAMYLKKGGPEMNPEDAGQLGVSTGDVIGFKERRFA